MTDAKLYDELAKLPEDLKRKATDFIAFLKHKEQPKNKKMRPLGLAKGKIIIKDSFDDPVPGFENY